MWLFRNFVEFLLIVLNILCIFLPLIHLRSSVVCCSDNAWFVSVSHLCVYSSDGNYCFMFSHNSFFFLKYKIPIRIFFNADIVFTNSLVYAYLSPLMLKDNLVGYSNFGWQLFIYLFIFEDLQYFPALLALSVSSDKSVVSLMDLPYECDVVILSSSF